MSVKLSKKRSIFNIIKSMETQDYNGGNVLVNPLFTDNIDKFTVTFENSSGALVHSLHFYFTHIKGETSAKSYFLGYVIPIDYSNQDVKLILSESESKLKSTIRLSTINDAAKFISAYENLVSLRARSRLES